MLLSLFLVLLNVVACRSHSAHPRINCMHIIDHLEPPLFVHELLINRFSFILQPIDSFLHMRLYSELLLIAVGAWTRVLVEVLH